MKYFATITTALFLVTMPLAHAATPTPTASATVKATTLLDEIPARGVLRVGLTGDYKPFSFVDKGPLGMQGLDVDMAKSLAEALGVRLEIVHTTWKTMLPDLLAGKFDIAMGGITETLPRAREALFSDPVMNAGKTAIALCADKTKYETLAQINQHDVRVVVNPGGTNELFDRAHLQKAQLIVVPTNPDTFQALLDHKADVMITDGVEAALQHQLHPELCETNPEHPFTHSVLAYMLPRDLVWQQFVNVWLRQTNLDGEHAALVKKWTGG